MEDQETKDPKKPRRSKINRRKTKKKKTTMTTTEKKPSVLSLMLLPVALLAALQFAVAGRWASRNASQLGTDDAADDLLRLTEVLAETSDATLVQEQPGSFKDVPIGRYHHDDVTAGAGMAACLLWKDDNDNLVEWLAFHYHNMPMRRVIFHPDPRAKTSPMEILERYTSRGMLDLDIWNATYVLGNAALSDEQYEAMDPRQQTDYFCRRQQEFMRKCFLQLHSEGKWSWVTTHDSDEFLIPNQHVMPEYRIGISVDDSHSSQQSRATTTAQASANKATILPTFDRITMMELLDLGRRSNISAMISSPCVGARRLLFGSRERSRDIAATNTTEFEGISTPWKQSKFNTYRWNWHIPFDKSGMGKAIVDISGIDPAKDLGKRSCNPHRPIKAICTQAQGHMNANLSPIVMHHYIGDRHHFTFREDPRAGLKWTRTDEVFERNIQRSKIFDTNTRGWVSGFVRSVGYETAQVLLRDVGELHDVVPPAESQPTDTR